jgi:hypothetical protein
MSIAGSLAVISLVSGRGGGREGSPALSLEELSLFSRWRKKRRSKASVMAGPDSESSVRTGRLLVVAAAYVGLPASNWCFVS